MVHDMHADELHVYDFLFVIVREFIDDSQSCRFRLFSPSSMIKASIA